MTGARKDGSAPSHRWVAFTNPYLRCGYCGQPTHSWHDEQQCGTPHEPCSVSWYLAPCGHHSDARSSCVTWTPEDGCMCLALLGRQDHETARQPRR